MPKIRVPKPNVAGSELPVQEGTPAETRSSRIGSSGQDTGLFRQTGSFWIECRGQLTMALRAPLPRHWLLELSVVRLQLVSLFTYLVWLCSHHDLKPRTLDRGFA